MSNSEKTLIRQNGTTNIRIALWPWTFTPSNRASKKLTAPMRTAIPNGTRVGARRAQMAEPTMAEMKPPNVAAMLPAAATFKVLSLARKPTMFPSCVKRTIPAAATAYPVSAVHLARVNVVTQRIVLPAKSNNLYYQALSLKIPSDPNPRDCV